MFIYEKNKLNKETGVVEQSLNVTFEGNKPVETPDVVITKDGVTGIKSDSNAYIAFNTLSAEVSGITISSISADGEVAGNVNINEQTGLEHSPILFKHSIGINITQYEAEQAKNIFTICDKNGTTQQIMPIDEDGFSNIQIGEYIFDIDNKTVDTPMGIYNINKSFYNILDNLYCIFIGQRY